MNIVKTIFKAALSCLITYSIVNNYTPKDHGEILAIASPLSTVAGILFGFIIAYVTAFASNSHNELIQNMRKTNMYTPLMSQLSHTGFGLITSCIFMVVSIFSPYKTINQGSSITWDFSLLVLGFTILIYSLFSFWECWRKVHKVIKYL
ncbi:conserved membrane hypothetical protein [Vibrio crassostreae]|uniref:hypothetical protein n=1 Tax=Vibrio crassostreae TaxID=246167 RepID=UPI001BD48DC9|nr:hypothetical protein [Vibrio crassostreae]CAK1724046.1 conserved membrane hypothetical protein [Vibrio crassostreae]CAK1941402.1 conserved membrane hypothetical protein [Vibrio crassostreae]CAK2324714.1 conserved membrane hypothetical protein [Vibrio crassostreae]CAK2331765.1 conserved membrane hypothetical protein [Vibrio crassostreae]CAK2390283.1 conserved membrane hypothetical protein [Vibrio crassostreae]